MRFISRARAHSKHYHSFWLVLGLAQFALSSGSGRASLPNDALFSAPSEAAVEQVARNEGKLRDAAAAPVRIPRDFFASATTASLAVLDGSGRLLAQPQTLTHYQESGAGGLSPDRIGCAELTSLAGVALCFEVMADVDSLGINAREMRLTGLSAWLRENLALNSAEPSFVSATRTPEGVDILFLSAPNTIRLSLQ